MAGHKKVFDRFLSTGFQQSNPLSSLERIIREYDVNYSKFLPKNKSAKILDIGCGMGHFLYYLEKKGFTNFEGIDIGLEQIEFCRQHITDRVRHIKDISGYLELCSKLFDLIIMNDVIEHIPRAKIIPTLESIYKKMKDNGTLIIKTGNAASLYGFFLRYIDFTHEIAFTENSLYQVLKAIGFTKIEIFPYRSSWSFNPKRILWLLLQRIWFFILNNIYFIEVGTDRPKILSKLLVAVAQK